MMKRTVAGLTAAAAITAGLVAGGISAGTADAQPGVYAGQFDGYDAWEYGPFTAQECADIVAREHQASPEYLAQHYPTPTFGTCYVKDDGASYYVAATLFAA